MGKKEVVAMLLAGGQGSRLGVLTATKAKPAVDFGGKYKIIDFAMSNCINSGVDTVGVLTQYMPLSLNRHIGIGVPWDLDRSNGGVSVLAPFVKGETGEWYSGTANAIYQNIDYLNQYDPEYVLILSGDHIYKMDYSLMLREHKRKKADATIAVLEVPLEEAPRFGIMNARGDDDAIYEFEEKPEKPKSNLASMGIYIFGWKKLKDALITDSKKHDDSDFGKHIIPYMLNNDMRLFAYRFNSYWKDVGTIESYWAANMELIKTLPDFNLYDDFWRIYTASEHQPPQFTAASADIKTSLISEGCEIYGSVYNSVLGPDVCVDEGATVRDSIIMEGSVVGKNAYIERAIIDEYTTVGEDVYIGFGENIPNEEHPHIYNTGISVVGQYSNIPDGIRIGKNCVVYGATSEKDYKHNALESGKCVAITEELA